MRDAALLYRHPPSALGHRRWNTWHRRADAAGSNLVLQARVRGAVRGALTPLSLPGLAKTLGLDVGGGAAAGPSLGAMLEELAASGEISGSLRGGGSTWVPAVHARAQQESVLSFFRCGCLLGD